MYDVLVIGGGPAGLYAAYWLAKAGRSVAVFEEHPEIGSPVHCTGLVASECFTRFDVPTQANQAAPRGARLHSPSGHVLSVVSAKDETVVVDRAAFDRGLAEQAGAAGAEIFSGCRVEALRRFRRHLVVRTSTSIGVERLVSGRLGILATGASYGLHRGLGFQIPNRFVYGAQVEVECAETFEVEVYFGNDVAPESFAWVVPFTQHGMAMAKIGLLSSRDAGRYLVRFLRSPQVAPRVRGPLYPYLRRPVPVWPLAETFSDRVLVIGDAAGLTKPTTGGGVYYSLLSAELAATTMSEALAAGDGSDRFLSRYQTAWQAALGPEIRTGALFRTFASELSDAQIDEAFSLVTGEPMVGLIRDHACFNWHKGTILALWRSAALRGFLWRALMRRGGRMLGAWRQLSNEPPTIRLPEKRPATD